MPSNAASLETDIADPTAGPWSPAQSKCAGSPSRNRCNQGQAGVPKNPSTMEKNASTTSGPTIVHGLSRGCEGSSACGCSLDGTPACATVLCSEAVVFPNAKRQLPKNTKHIWRVM